MRSGLANLLLQVKASGSPVHPVFVGSTWVFALACWLCVLAIAWIVVL